MNNIKKFFKNCEKYKYQVINFNGKFIHSELLRFFYSNNINSFKKTIKNPVLISSIALALSVSNLYLSSLNNSKNKLEENNIKNYLFLKKLEKSDISLYNSSLNLYFKKYNIDMDTETNLAEFLLKDGKIHKKEFVDNLNWDYKTPAIKFKKYFSNKYADKIPSIKDLNEIEIFYGLPNNILFYMAHKESRFSLYKISEKSAKGFLGFQEATARDFSLINEKENHIFNAYAAADTAARYLLWLNGYVNGKNSDIKDLDKDIHGYSNLDYSLAAYNAGPHKVKKGKGKRVPNFKETLDYINDINLLISGNGYIVKRGDNVYNISDKFNISLTNLFRNNLDIEDNNDLKAGEIIIISNNEYEEISLKIEKDHSIYKIAKQTGIELASLLSYNNLDKQSIIKVGQEIKIPPIIKQAIINKSRKI